MAPLLSHQPYPDIYHAILSEIKTSPLLLSSGVQQGSDLGPTYFLTYTEGTTDISAHLLLYHLYANNTQTYATGLAVLC